MFLLFSFSRFLNPFLNIILRFLKFFVLTENSQQMPTMSDSAHQITLRAPLPQYANTENGSIASLKSQVPMTPTHSTATKTNGFGCERRSSLRRNLSYGNILAANEAKVLVIYTGGTIGMMRNDKEGKFKCNNYLLFFG